MSAPDLDLPALIESWELHLRAERKSPDTIRSYLAGVRRFLDWADRTDTPPTLDRRTVAAFTAGLLDDGAEASTARSRQLSVRRFSAWLLDEGEIENDALIGLRAPKVDTKIVDRLSDAECELLLKACAGRTFLARRDEAVVRVLLETGLRASELLGITVDDVDLSVGRLIVQRGKGGRGRIVAIGPQTVRALDRYLRLRKAHRLADTPPLLLGAEGQGLSYSGLYRALRRRAATAGLTHLHPHRLRHTMASRWLAAGGSEGGLMSAAGWQHRAMIDRYTASAAAERSQEEARRLNLGDFG